MTECDVTIFLHFSYMSQLNDVMSQAGKTSVVSCPIVSMSGCSDATDMLIRIIHYPNIK